MAEDLKYSQDYYKYLHFLKTYEQGKGRKIAGVMDRGGVLIPLYVSDNDKGVRCYNKFSRFTDIQYSQALADMNQLVGVGGGVQKSSWVNNEYGLVVVKEGNIAKADKPASLHVFETSDNLVDYPFLRVQVSPENGIVFGHVALSTFEFEGKLAMDSRKDGFGNNSYFSALFI